MGTYKELIEAERAEYIGKDVIYKGAKHKVVDVDYNGALLIDLPTEHTDTTAISRFDKDLELIPVCCICGKQIEGWSNNAEPVKQGRCCDDCNWEYVIPARMLALYTRRTQAEPKQE